MYRLRVLGGFALEGAAGGAAPPLPQRRAEAVLAVLAVCGDVGCTRERLLGLLWPESDEAHSRHGLRDALHFIRQAVGPEAIRASGDMLHLDCAVVDSDVHQFTQALKAEQRADAVKAYGGPLLDGFHVDGAPEFEQWLDGERARLGRECGEALEHLAEAAEVEEQWKEATRWWARALELDPLNSHLVLQQVRALAAMGDRANAIVLADAHARRLKAELDLEPDRDVLAKIERVRRGELPTPRILPAGTGRAARRHDDAPAAGEPAAPPVVPAAPARPPTAWRWALRGAWATLVLVVLALAVVAVWERLSVRNAQHYPRTAIAVLPFENLSADTAHAYIAGGLHDELLTQLAKVSALKVIGRTSVLAYRGTAKPLRQIGDELEVGSIVEGTVQLVGGRLRVIVQLVDPVTQTHLWAENYDRSLADAFEVESDIAQRVVGAVGATLTDSEAGAIATPPTENAAAYRLYLQGLDYVRRPWEARTPFRIAQVLYERALALDPDFALAHAALSLVHGEMYADVYDRSPARLAAQRREAETAVHLAPNLPQARLAMGAADLNRGDPQRALGEFTEALRGAPNDAQIWEWVYNANYGLGRWDSALAAVDHAIRLDPRNSTLYGRKGNTLDYIRRYPEAIAAFRRALVLAPDFFKAHIMIGWVYVRWKGQWDTALAALAPVPLEVDPEEHLWALFALRKADSLLAALRALPTWEREDTWASQSRWTYIAWAHQLQGDSAAARAAWDTAVVKLTALERVNPGDERLHRARGIALACLGRRAEALREADFFARSGGVSEARATILLWAGEVDSALVVYERLLAEPGVPGYFTAPSMPFNPEWDPIRRDPRFQALLVKYANPEAGAGQRVSAR